MANSPFASSACCFPYTGWSLGGSAYHPQTPKPALTPSIAATGPLEERQIAYVCREALKVAGPVGLLTPWSPGAGQAAQQAPVCVGVGWGGVGGVPQAELPEGL